MSRNAENKRAERVPLGAPRQKLTADKHIRKGYVPRWVNDNDTRLMDAQAAGYEFVTAERPSDQEDDDTRVSRLVGTREDGSPMRAYLMEIPEPWYEEDQKAKQAPLDEFDHAIRRGIVEGASGQDKDSFYVPGGQNSHKVSTGPVVRTK